MPKKTSLILTIVLALLLSFSSQASAMEIQKIIVNYSPYTNGIPGDPLDDNQITTDLTRISNYAYAIKIFSCTGEMQKVLRIAKQLGLPVIAGCWLSKDKSQNEIELAALIDACINGYVVIAVIGSETLYRRDLSASELIDYINRFKEATKILPTPIPVCVADSYHVLTANPAVVNACDIVMLNSYPYWEGIDVSYAATQLRGSYWGFKNQYPNKIVVIGETGWPSAGNTIGNAVADPISAAWYFWTVMSWVKTEGIFVIWFEAFDEPWKANYEGPQGAHWGLWDQYGVLKPYMEYGFSEYIAPPEYWGGKTNPPPDNTPKIEFTYVPPIGSSDNLRGTTYNVSPDEYAVAVYIYVGGWWIKPSFAYPTTPIAYDGTFICDITTGGNDIKATKITAFVIPKSYTPPGLGGSASLPSELHENSIASIEVTR